MNNISMWNFIQQNIDIVKIKISRFDLKVSASNYYKSEISFQKNQSWLPSINLTSNELKTFTRTVKNTSIS